MGLEGRHLDDDILAIIKQHTLCKLQLQISRIGSGAIKRCKYLFYEVLLAKLAGTDINCNSDVGGFFPTRPGCDLSACCFEDPVSKREDQPRFLRQEDELAGRKNAARGMFPSDESLSADYRAAIYLRLIVQ